MKLTDDNFLAFAMRNYRESVVSVEEFQEDVHRIKYLKKLLKKYQETGDLKVRLVLNHLTVLYNVFNPSACTKMLVLKLPEFMSQLKPFIIVLNYWKDGKIEGIEGQTNLYGSDFPLDEVIVNMLREEFKGFRL